MEDTAAGEDDVDVAIAALRGAIAAHESASPDRDDTPEPADVDAEVLSEPNAAAEQLAATPGASMQVPGQQQRSAAASPVRSWRGFQADKQAR